MILRESLHRISGIHDASELADSIGTDSTVQSLHELEYDLIDLDGDPDGYDYLQEVY